MHAYGYLDRSEVFHKTLSQLLKDLRGYRVYINDLIVWGYTNQDHDARFEAVLYRLVKVRLRLNLEKCHFRQTEIMYLGDHITVQGSAT